MREAATRLLQVQVDRDCYAAHVADLEVEDDEVGMVFGDGIPHVLPAGHLDHLLTPPDERGPDLLAHPARVGGNKDFHRAGNLPGRVRPLDHRSAVADDDLAKFPELGGDERTGEVSWMAGLNLLIVLAVILIGVPIWALIWGQKERRPQNT